MASEYVFQDYWSSTFKPAPKATLPFEISLKRIPVAAKQPGNWHSALGHLFTAKIAKDAMKKQS
jgi:hypothetical protein